MNDTKHGVPIYGTGDGFTKEECEKMAQDQLDEEYREELERYNSRVKNREKRETNGANGAVPAPQPNGIQPDGTAGVPVIPKPNGKAKAPSELAYNKAVKYLTERYKFRSNILTNETEFCGNEGLWEEVSPIKFDTFYHDIKQANINIKSEELNRMLRNEKTAPKYDAIIEYFNSLPKWNGQENILGFFAQIQLTKQEDSEQDFDLFRRWFVYLVAQATMRAQRPNDAVLILCGTGGTGKSTFFRKLIPEALQKYYAPDFGDLHDKDSRRKLGSSMLIVFDELSALIGKNADKEAFKSVTQMPKVQIRLPYDKNTTTMIRRASFGGTVDKWQFASDDNTRRLWVIPIHSIRFSNLVDEDFLAQMYAEALHYLDSGFRYWINSEETKALNVRNEDYQTTNIVKELLQAHYVPALPCSKLHFKTTTTVLKQLMEKYPNSIFNSISPKILGLTMRELFSETLFKVKINGVSTRGYSLQFIDCSAITNETAESEPESEGGVF